MSLNPGSTGAVVDERNGRKSEQFVKEMMRTFKSDISSFSGWVTQSPMLCLYLEGQELAREPNVPGWFSPKNLGMFCNFQIRIVEKYGHVHLSAGDLLRAERASPGSQVHNFYPIFMG